MGFASFIWIVSWLQLCCFSFERGGVDGREGHVVFVDFDVAKTVGGNYIINWMRG